MEIRHAQAFIAVAEELHFGRAAQRLHIAQPPLSRLIRSLEAELGVTLFDRNTHRVALTPVGETLLEAARELVMIPQRMQEIARNSRQGEMGRIKLGFGEALVNNVVGDLARELRQTRPGLSLELHSSQFSYQGLEKVLDGSLDMLVGRWDFLPQSVDSRVIAREELLIALPENHRLAERDAVTAEDLADEPWVVVLPGKNSTLPNRLNMLAAAGSFEPRIVQVSPDSSTLVFLVGAGTGVALTLSSVRDHIPGSGVVYKPIRPAQEPMEVRLIWRRRDPNPALTPIVALAERLAPDK